MGKIILRIAEIKGIGIKNRCRKTEGFLISAIGKDNCEAIKNLIEKIKLEKEKYKQFSLKNIGCIYNCEKCENGFLSYSLFPECFPVENSFLQFDYVESSNLIVLRN